MNTNSGRDSANMPTPPNEANFTKLKIQTKQQTENPGLTQSPFAQAINSQ